LREVEEDAGERKEHEEEGANAGVMRWKEFDTPRKDNIATIEIDLIAV